MSNGLPATNRGDLFHTPPSVRKIDAFSVLDHSGVSALSHTEPHDASPLFTACNLMSLRVWSAIVVNNMGGTNIVTIAALNVVLMSSSLR